MTWQEYQAAVAELYEQAEDIGEVQRDVRIPDKDTGQLRQIDVLLGVTAHGHTLNVVIDAKYRKEKLDVKDVEEVLALAQAVKACKAVIVAANGWTDPALRKADACSVDLIVLSTEKALDLIVVDKWEMCPSCRVDCIVLDQDGMTDLGGRRILWWLAGQCRHCQCGFAWCQDCGERFHLVVDESHRCGCGHTWSVSAEGIRLHFGSRENDEVVGGGETPLVYLERTHGGVGEDDDEETPA